MRLLARALLLSSIALPVAAFGALWLSVQHAPSVVRELRLAPEDIAHAKRVIERHAPRRTDARTPHTVAISEQELDLMLNYAANHFGGGAARVRLGPGTASVQASIEIPRSPFGRYLNVDFSLRETGALPRFEHLRVGRLPVPATLADLLLREALRRLAATDRGEFAADIVKSVRISDGGLAITYLWSGEIARRARDVLLSATDQERLRAYHDRLVVTVNSAPPRVSLAALMSPVFATVLERAGTGDPTAESRAAIVVLAFYVNGTGLAAILPAAAGWPRPAPRAVTLAGRHDLAKHFVISAAIAAEAGSPLADAIGLYKEVEDARGGSGFSFNDIAADRAGVRFGEIASRSPERARGLAQALAAGAQESDFMPDVADLPEFVPQAEFVRRYGGIGGPGYERTMAAIETRIASRPLFR